MLDGYISDLEPGDEFRPVTYTLTELIVAEYVHGVEELSEYFHGSHNRYGRVVRPPTCIHMERMRLLEENCTKERRLAGEAASDWRIHYEYHSEQKSSAFVGEELVISGRVPDVYVKRGRVFNRYEIDVHAGDGRHVARYYERMMLRYAKD